MDLSSIDPAWLANIPAARPPPGVTSNFIDPPSRDAEAKAIMCTALPLMLSALSLRLYVRTRVMRNFGIDDVLAILSAMSAVGYCGIAYALFNGPIGEQGWDIPLAALNDRFFRLNFALLLVHNFAITFTKATLLVLYLRLFRPSRRAVVMIRGGLAVIIIGYAAIMISYIVIVTPQLGHPFEWITKKGIKAGTATFNIIASGGIFGVVSDFYILFIPMHLVVELHLPLGKKLGVAGIFLTAMLACVCSIINTVYRFKMRSPQNEFWDTITTIELCVIELNIGIICACLPVLLVLLKRISKNQSYIGLKQYLRSRRSKPVDRSRAESSEGHKKPDRIDIAIPQPAMTGLRSFIFKGIRHGTQRSYQLQSYDELVTMDDYYHNQLKKTVV